VLFFLAISTLGENYFYLFLIPVIYWLYSRRIGVEIASVLLLTYSLNTVMKESIRIERPPRETWVGGVQAQGYSFPSGHAQGSAALWTYLIVELKRKWVVILGVVLVMLISYSRIFLGVHSWPDILGGILLGFFLVLVFHFLRNPIYQFLESTPTEILVILAGVIPLVIFLTMPTLVHAKVCGFIQGVWMGTILERRRVRMEDATKPKQRIYRAITGFPISGAILFGLSTAIPDTPGYQFPVMALSGLSVMLIAPAVFKMLKI
jgi:hypothetical protein